MPSENLPAIGVAVGKFNPPHLGHLLLIAQAASAVDRLFVLLCDRTDQTLTAAARADWLRDAVGQNVEVLITADDLPAQNGPWAQRALALLPAAPDIAFTSETWGPSWAQLMGARHVCVDLHRGRCPISASQIRADLGRNFQWLAPAARSALARRVVLIGGESSGKTTLAAALAGELDTVWVPEHGRMYSDGRAHLSDSAWSSDEFVRIARAQQALDRDLGRLARNGVVVADTDAMVTAVWHERYLGTSNSTLDSLAAESPPAAYLACAPDFPWVQDGTRESRTQRDQMYAAMLGRARASACPVVELTGPHTARLAHAMQAVAPLRHFDQLV